MPNQCGDGFVNKAAPYNEACDDGNKVSGDGCNTDCTVIEAGYFCGVPGVLCTHVCSNGIVDHYRINSFKFISWTASISIFL